jgi:hypothetical protein
LRWQRLAGKGSILGKPARPTRGAIVALCDRMQESSGSRAGCDTWWPDRFKDSSRHHEWTCVRLELCSLAYVRNKFFASAVNRQQIARNSSGAPGKREWGSRASSNANRRLHVQQATETNRRVILASALASKSHADTPP